MITQTPSSKPYSVILDIDETVLDNSPYQAKNVKNGKTFNPKSWDKWVKSKKAKAVPGVKEFLNYANEKGVKIYYVSDRADSQVDATKENLESEGLPVQDKSQLLFLKNEMTSKESRRKMVGESTDIALLCGDNLVDFAEFSKTSQTDRTKMMSELENEFGNKFIILPNPMYGSWETTIYNGKKLDSKRQVKAREKAIEKNSAKD